MRRNDGAHKLTHGQDKMVTAQSSVLLFLVDLKANPVAVPLSALGHVVAYSQKHNLPLYCCHRNGVLLILSSAGDH